MSFGIIPVTQFGTANSGIVPASPGGTTQFLRADGTWSVPPGTNASGLFGGSIFIPTKASTGLSNIIGGGAVTDVANIGILVAPSSAAGDGVYKAQPATPYIIDALVTCVGIDTTPGIFFSDGTKYATLYCNSDFSAHLGLLAVDHLTSFPPPVGSTPYAQGWQLVKSFVWLRIANDGTTLTFSVSADGIDYTGATSELVGAFITPTRVGFFSNNSGKTTLMSWREH